MITYFKGTNITDITNNLVNKSITENIKQILQKPKVELMRDVEITRRNWIQKFNVRSRHRKYWHSFFSEMLFLMTYLLGYFFKFLLIPYFFHGVAMSRAQGTMWDRVFNSGLSKFCGRQSLKIYLVLSWILYLMWLSHLHETWKNCSCKRPKVLTRKKDWINWLYHEKLMSFTTNTIKLNSLNAKAAII